MKVKAKQVSNLKNPWILVDDETGKVLDDAQGYGYRTAQKAHAAYAYRHSNGKHTTKMVTKNTLITLLLTNE